MKYSDKKDDFKMTRYRAPIVDRLSETELRELDTELRGFYEEVLVQNPKPEKLNIFNEKKWLVSRGAMNKDGAVIIKNYKATVYNDQGHVVEPKDCEPIFYEQCMADLDQWKKWLGRKEFGERKKVEGLQKIAEKMTVKQEEIVVDDIFL
jgi:hypothetical protein